MIDYVEEILNAPAEEELKNIDIKNIPSRWNIIYLKITRIEIEQNDELIYYNQSNDLLNNIRTNKRPFNIIYFLKEFMKYYEKFKNKLLNLTKKYFLLGLCNCEYVDTKIGGYLDFIKYLSLSNDSELDIENHINNYLNPNKYYDGKLQEAIKRFCQSNLAKTAFLKIFQLKEIPNELEKEIFSDNISKFICYFPFSSYDNTERTIRRQSLILINTTKDKKILYLKNSRLNELLTDFCNLVVRKFIFGHEHQHLSGGLLYISNQLNRLNTPPHKIDSQELIYDFENKSRGERGEIFELLAYGKVFQIFTIFDLIFIANEENDKLNIDAHLIVFKEYCLKKKNLRDELKDFPKGQIFSDIINKIYNELIEDNESYKILTTKAIAYKKENIFNDKTDLNLLEDSENIIAPEICPLSLGIIPYRHFKNNL